MRVRPECARVCARLRALLVAAVLGLGLVEVQAARAQAVRFDPRLVFGAVVGPSAVSRFDRGNPVEPGRYRSDIVVNGVFVDTRDVLIRAQGGSPTPQPCLDRALVRRLDLAARRLLPSARAWLAGSGPPECLRAGRIAPGLRASFDASRLRVNVAAPAVLLARRPRGWVSPRSWSNGIAAARLNYQFNAVRGPSGAGAGQATQVFLGLAGGVNVGAWQWRHSGTLDGTTGQGLHYETSSNALRHDIARLRGYVLLGQGQTNGDLLDSVSFRGVMLSSDRRMLPASRQGFAPVIHGFAAAPSVVRVTQNGVLLYQTSVPAGAFAINDLYPPAAGAALQVTVTGLDGRASRFSVPVSALPQLRRPGQASYQLMVGRLRGSGSDASRPALLASVLYGLNDAVTGEAGIIAARGYAAQALGAAFNTRLGAWEVDLTRSRFNPAGLAAQHGQRLRGLWNLARGATGLSLSVSRQSRGYYGALDTLGSDVTASAGPAATSLTRVREQEQLVLTQAFGSRGSLYVSASSTRSWDVAQRQSTFALGYAGSLGAAQWTVSLSRQLGTDGTGPSTALNVGISLPLGPEPGAASTRFGVTDDSRAGRSAQWAFSASAGADQAFSYGAQASAGAGSRSTALDASWRGSAGSLGASATRFAAGGNSTGSLSVHASGGVVGFADGVTLTPYLGPTIALIRADAARGAPVLGGAGSRIDSHGYGVVTYLTPYAADMVGIDAPNAVALRRTSARVIPRAGAVVEVRLRARRGRWALLGARRADGSPLPFAAQVFDASHRLVGYVGQGSRIDAHLRSDSGRLVVRWGDGAHQACHLDYRLPPRRGGALPAWVHGAVCVAAPRGQVR